MFKRILLLLSSIICIFALTACGIGKKGADENVDKNENVKCEISLSSGLTTVAPGESVGLFTNLQLADETDGILWSIEGNDSSQTYVDNDSSTLYVGMDETTTILKINAVLLSDTTKRGVLLIEIKEDTGSQEDISEDELTFADDLSMEKLYSNLYAAAKTDEEKAAVDELKKHKSERKEHDHTFKKIYVGDLSSEKVYILHYCTFPDCGGFYKEEYNDASHKYAMTSQTPPSEGEPGSRIYECSDCNNRFEAKVFSSPNSIYYKCDLFDGIFWHDIDTWDALESGTAEW